MRDADAELVGALRMLFVLQRGSLTDVGHPGHEDKTGGLFKTNGSRFKAHRNTIVAEVFRVLLQTVHHLVIDLRSEKRAQTIGDEVDGAGLNVPEQFGERKAPGFDVGLRGVGLRDLRVRSEGPRLYRDDLRTIGDVEGFARDGDDEQGRHDAVQPVLGFEALES